jgi:hypothetical protein
VEVGRFGGVVDHVAIVARFTVIVPIVANIVVVRIIIEQDKGVTDPQGTLDMNAASTSNAYNGVLLVECQLRANTPRHTRGLLFRLLLSGCRAPGWGLGCQLD